MKKILSMMLFVSASLFAGKGSPGGRDVCVDVSCSRDGSCTLSFHDCGDSRGHGESRSEGYAYSVGYPCTGYYNNSSGPYAAQSASTLPPPELTVPQMQSNLAAGCYIASNGQVCTKAQVIKASEELSTIIEGLLAGHGETAIGYVTKDIGSRIFGLERTPLGCAIVSKKAPDELCRTVARIRALDQEGAALKREIEKLKVDIQKIQKESDKIKKDIDARVKAHEKHINTLKAQQDLIRKTFG